MTLSDAEWMEDLAFAVDVTALMNEPHPKLQLSKVCLHMKCKPGENIHETVAVSLKPNVRSHFY